MEEAAYQFAELFAVLMLLLGYQAVACIPIIKKVVK